MASGRARASALIVLGLALGLYGCAGDGNSHAKSNADDTPPVGAPAAVPPGPVPASSGSGAAPPTAGRQPQIVDERMTMDPTLGAGGGSGTMLIYSAITGHVPFAGVATSGRIAARGGEAEREAKLEAELEREERRGEVLEDEIAAELERQEDLLDQIESEEHPSRLTAARDPIADIDLDERADPRVAPTAPTDRDLPLAIFDTETVHVMKGTWGNKRTIVAVKRTLDADRDGKPEQVRYYDEESGDLIRKEQDQTYNGSTDTWTTYEGGQVVGRVMDTNDDGDADTWESYRNGRMTERAIDREHDGVKDAFYRYEGKYLVEERHDANGDSVIDHIVIYEKRHRVRAEEDRSHDGAMDSWTTYRVVGGEEVIARIERDTNADGKPDVFEVFSAKDGVPVLARREEDKNGDGSIDVTSIYENGKLVRREISDPTLVPL
jgi:hypothetical protein